MPVALTIAGSDPSGGAGIQSDLRTFAALGVVGLSAITALTVQNSQGVQSVHLTDAELLEAQIINILSDTQPDAVKIGMLGGVAQVHAVVRVLQRFRPPNIILDPVLASTGGISLLDESGRQALWEQLIPLCDLVTPNLDEASFLTGLPVYDLTTMRIAGEHLIQQGAKAVLVKGGHLPNAPHDLLIRVGKDPVEFTGQRIKTQDTHGTGCLFSAAIAANLAQDIELSLAVRNAKVVMNQALQSPVRVGKGRGYPNVMSAVQKSASMSSRTHTERLEKLKGVYVLTDPDLNPSRNAESIVRAALSGGSKIVQLRDKHLSVSALTDTARHLRDLVWAAHGLLIINDRVDVTFAAEADGVHLGPDDLHPKDARRLLGPDVLIGVSVGTVAEAEQMAAYASYFGVGAIYGTQTKLDAGAPIGTERIREIKAAFPQMPIVAIGGIQLGNIAEVAAAGAESAAVISAVVNAPDMQAAVRELSHRFWEAKGVLTATKGQIESAEDDETEAQ